MPAIDFIDSTEALTDALDSLCRLNLTVPSLFIALHGIRVCRNGRLCILVIYVPPLEAVFMIDVTVLDHLTFSTSSLPPKVGSRRGLTLKAIFESPDIPKVFYDGEVQTLSMLSAKLASNRLLTQFISIVRTDSDNLFNVFDVSLKGVIDLQLCELVCQLDSGTFQLDPTLSLGGPGGLEEILQPSCVSPHYLRSAPVVARRRNMSSQLLLLFPQIVDHE